MDIKQIANLFSNAEINSVVKIEAGHINTSYLVSDTRNEKFILQRINQNVFKNPVWVIDNLVKINDHLIGSDYPYRVAKLLYTHSNESFFIDKSGLWRAIEYIERSKTILICTNAETAFIAAKAYGHFVGSLSELNQKKMEIVIPDFHNPQKRYDELESAIKINFNNRVEEVDNLISQARQYKHIIAEHKKATTDLPIRLVHNDTKISNLLFNEDLTDVMAIIDLDTVMPGYIINDFGDMVRSICNPAAEDETNLNKVSFNNGFYKRLLQGYLSALKGSITSEEKEALPIGIKSIIYTQFIRFLSDYLNGDNYYNIAYDDQNLNRARVQLHLLEQIMEPRETLKNLI